MVVGGVGWGAGAVLTCSDESCSRRDQQADQQDNRPKPEPDPDMDEMLWLLRTVHGDTAGAAERRKPERIEDDDDTYAEQQRPADLRTALPQLGELGKLGPPHGARTYHADNRNMSHRSPSLSPSWRCWLRTSPRPSPRLPCPAYRTAAASTCRAATTAGGCRAAT